MLDRLWEAVDADKQGGLSEDELLQGLGGAFSRSRAARLRWHWQTFYDTGLRGELGAHAIFALLSQVSSRLEDDAMLLCRLASAKLSHGQRAAVTLEEYTAHYASAPEDEPDALGLRRRALPPKPNAEAVRARARGLLEARQLLQAAECHTGGIDGRSGGSSARAAASTAAAAHEIFARAATASEVYTRVSKPLKPF